MSRARIYIVPIASLLPVLRGEKRITNLPADAEIVAADYGTCGLGVRVHSTSFPESERGKQLPTFPAVLEKRA